MGPGLALALGEFEGPRAAPPSSRAFGANVKGFQPPYDPRPGPRPSTLYKLPRFISPTIQSHVRQARAMIVHVGFWQPADTNPAPSTT